LNRCKICKKFVWFWQGAYYAEEEKGETWKEVHTVCAMELLIANLMKGFEN